MSVTAPIKVPDCVSLIEQRSANGATAKRRLLSVVNTGHRDVIEGNTQNVSNVTQAIRKNLGLASRNR